MKRYDYIIVGAGLFGATIANLLHNKGFKVLVLEKRDHIGGNCYDEYVENNLVHLYGPHFFHTDNELVWSYIRKFGEFKEYHHKACSYVKSQKDKFVSLPFNMYTFENIFKCSDINKLKELLDEDIKKHKVTKPENLEEQAINLVGEKIYKTLIKGYTEKQWNKSCLELSPDIIKRLPVRFEYNDDYFNDKYQGVPKEGYTALIRNMLKGIDVKLNADFIKHKKYYLRQTRYNVIYTGALDELENYKYGRLEYRSVEFDHKVFLADKLLPKAVVNFADKDIAYTRCFESKQFTNPKDEHKKTIISFEKSVSYDNSKERSYPVNNVKNNVLYEKYVKSLNPKIVLGGRLGEYKYYDMDDTIYSAFNLYMKLCEERECGGK